MEVGEKTGKRGFAVNRCTELLNFEMKYSAMSTMTSNTFLFH